MVGVDDGERVVMCPTFVAKIAFEFQRLSSAIFFRSYAAVPRVTIAQREPGPRRRTDRDGMVVLCRVQRCSGFWNSEREFPARSAHRDVQRLSPPSLYACRSSRGLPIPRGFMASKNPRLGLGRESWLVLFLRVDCGSQRRAIAEQRRIVR